MKFTVKSAAEIQLPAGVQDTVFWDDDIAGFGLRLRQGGMRTWIYRYRIGRKQRSITLGNAKSVPLALARENAGRLEAKVRLGGDPASDKEAARVAADNLVGALIDQYIDVRQNEWRPNSLRNVRLYLLQHCKPLHGLPVTAVAQRNVADLLNKIAKSSGTVTSNRVRATLAAFLSWVIRQGIRLPDGNVVSHTDPLKEQSRDRVLKQGELRAIWHASGDSDYSAILKLLLLTGQRAAEIGSLRWEEVHDDHIALPSARTKNKRAHIIPLSAQAKAILDNHRILGRTFVFGRDDSHGFRGWAAAKERLDERVAKIAEPWIVHDLRRTVATGLQQLGVRLEVTEAVLNHVSGSRGGIAGVYQRHEWAAEKREALERWATHVLKMVG